MRIDELQLRLQEINSECAEITSRAESEKRDLTSEEESSLQGLLDEYDRIKLRIDQLARLQTQTDELNRPQGRRTAPASPASDPADAPIAALAPVPTQRRLTVPAEPIRERKGGFKSLGEMAFHVARAARQGGSSDARLERLAAATTYGNEGTGADGGYSVPPDFRSEIMEKVLGESSLLSYCDQITTSSNVFTCPMDETTPWQTSGGVQAYWDGENVAATQSKPALEERTVRLNKVRALVPVTEELLEDAPAMDAYLRRKAPEKIAFKISLAVLQGTGSGQPLGILNSPALVTVSKEQSQINDSVIANNIIKMWARLYAPCRPRSVWLINQDIEPYLNTMSIAGRDNDGNFVTGWGIPVYMPAGGLSNTPFGTLMGRPVIPTQACETLGDLGDIVLADLTQYLALIKSGTNPRFDVSMHLMFDADVQVFKWVLRIGGMPWWNTYIAPRDGSNNLSAFVTLQAR